MSLSSLPVRDYESDPTFPTDTVGKSRFYKDWFADYAEQNKSNPDAVIEANKHYGDTLRGIALEEAATSRNGDAEDYINNRIKELNDPSYLSKTYKKDSDMSLLDDYYKSNNLTPPEEYNTARFRASIYDGHDYKTTGGVGKPVDIQTDQDFFSIAPFKSANGREMALVKYSDGSSELTEPTILNPQALASFVRKDRRDKFKSPDTVALKIKDASAGWQATINSVKLSGYNFAGDIYLQGSAEEQQALKEIDSVIANPELAKVPGKWYNSLLSGGSSDDQYVYTPTRRLNEATKLSSLSGAVTLPQPEAADKDRNKFIEQLQKSRERIIGIRNKNIAAYIENRREAGTIPRAEDMVDLMAATQNKKDSMEGVLSYFTGEGGASKLFGVIVNGALESTVQTGIPIAAALLGRGAGPIGVLSAAGATGYSVEEMASFSQFIVDKAQQRGLNITDPNSIIALLDDQTLLKEAEDFATKRAQVVGAVEGAASLATLGIAKAVKSVFVQAAAGAGIGVVSGAAGERFAQIATGQPTDYRDVILEGFTELAGTAIEAPAQGIKWFQDRNKSKFATTPVEEVKDFTKKEVVKTTVEQQKNELLNKVGAKNVRPTTEPVTSAVNFAEAGISLEPRYVDQASPKETQLTDKPQLTDFPDLATQFSGEEGLLQPDEEEGDLLADYEIPTAVTEGTVTAAQPNADITVAPADTGLFTSETLSSEEVSGIDDANRNSIRNWLISGKGKPRAPSKVFRGVDKGIASPTNKEGKFTHVSPWAGVAERGGKGAFGVKGAFSMFSASAGEDTIYYRGGALAETPFESTRIGNIQGATWGKIMDQAKALFDKRSKEIDAEIVSSNPDYEGFTEEELQRFRNDNKKRELDRVIDDVRNATFESDVAGKPGRFRGQKFPAKINTERPAMVSDAAMERWNRMYNKDIGFTGALNIAAAKVYKYGQNFAQWSKEFVTLLASKGITLSKQILESIYNTVNNTYKYFSSFFNRHATPNEVTNAIKALQSNPKFSSLLQILASGDEIKEDQLTEIIQGMGLAENFKGRVNVLQRMDSSLRTALKEPLSERYGEISYSEKDYKNAENDIRNLKPGDVVISGIGIPEHLMDIVPDGVLTITPVLVDKEMMSKLKQQKAVGEKGLKTLNVREIEDSLPKEWTEEQKQAAKKERLAKEFPNGYILKTDKGAQSIGLEELNKGDTIMSQYTITDANTKEDIHYDVIAQERKDFDQNKGYRVHVFNDGKQFHLVPFGTFARGKVNAEGTEFINNSTGIPVINYDEDADAAEEFGLATVNSIADKSGLAGSFLGLDVEWDKAKGEWVVLEFNPSDEKGGSGFSFSPFVIDSIYSIFTGKTPIIAKLVNALNGTNNQSKKPSNLSNYIYDKFQDLMEYIGVTAHAVPRSKSNISDADNQKYLDAVNSGDLATAQKMVDEAAIDAGYTVEGWHGNREGGAFTEFKQELSGSNTASDNTVLGHFFANREVASTYNQYQYYKGFESKEKMMGLIDSAVALEAELRKKSPNHLVLETNLASVIASGDAFWGPEIAKSYLYVAERNKVNSWAGSKLLKSFVNNTRDFRNPQNAVVSVPSKNGSLRRFYLKASTGGIAGGPFLISNKAIHDPTRWMKEEAAKMAKGEGSATAFKSNDPIHDVGINGVNQLGIDDQLNLEKKDISDKFYKQGPSHIWIIPNGSNVKSADPVVYDDNGNIVPLNRRFQESKDIRGSLSNFLSNALTGFMEKTGALAFAVPNKRTVRINGQKVNINNLSPDTVTQLTEIQDNEKKAKRGAAVSMPASQKQEVYNSAVREHEQAEITKLLEKYEGAFRVESSPGQFEIVIPETLSKAMERVNDFLSHEITDPAQTEAKALRDSMLRKQKLLFVNEQLIDQASEYFSSETFNALPEEMREQVMAGIALATNVDMDSKESEMRRANFALDSLFNHDSPIGLAKLIQNNFLSEEANTFRQLTERLGERGVRPAQTLDPAIPDYLRFLPFQNRNRAAGELNSFVPHSTELFKLVPFKDSQRWLFGFIGQYMYSVQQATIDSKPDLEGFEAVINANFTDNPSIDNLVSVDIAAQLTQYDDASTNPVEALRKIHDDIKDSNDFAILKGTFEDRQEALFYNTQLQNLTRGVNYATMTEDQIINAVEANLTPQQRNVLEAARTFGITYHAPLAYASAMSKGKTLPRYRNYIKRQSSQIVKQGGLFSKEKDLDSEESVLKSRQGRRYGQFYRFNIASAIKSQLTETHYEINSAVHRENLNTALDPRTPLSQAMDLGKRAKVQPSTRIAEIIGNYHHSMITDPFQVGGFTRIALRLASITTSLIFANPKNILAQSLSPLAASVITSLSDGHFMTLNGILAATGTNDFAEMDNWIQENIPTIVERLENFDQSLDDIKRFFSSSQNQVAMVFKNRDFRNLFTALYRSIPNVTDKGVTILSDLTRKFSSYFTSRPDVWAAKKIFLAKYVQFLQDAGIVSGIPDFVARVRANDRSIIDPASIQQSIAYVDELTGTSSAYASRAEAFKNKTSLGMIATRGAFFARQAQISLGGAFQKNLAHLFRHGYYAIRTGSPAQREAATSALAGLIGNFVQNGVFRLLGWSFIMTQAYLVYAALKADAEDEDDPELKKQKLRIAENEYRTMVKTRDNYAIKDTVHEVFAQFFPAAPSVMLSSPGEWAVNAGIFDLSKDTGVGSNLFSTINDVELRNAIQIEKIHRDNLQDDIASLKKAGLSTKEKEDQIQDINYKIQHLTELESIKYARVNLGEFGNLTSKAESFIDVMVSNVKTEQDKEGFKKAIEQMQRGEITIDQLNSLYGLSLENMASQNLKDETDIHLYNIFKTGTGGLGFGPAISMYSDARKAAQVEVEKRKLQDKRATNRGLRKAGLSPRQLREVE